MAGSASLPGRLRVRNPAVVRLSGPSAERYYPCVDLSRVSIGASLLERPEQVTRYAGRETAAFVYRLDREHVRSAGASRRDAWFAAW